MSDARQGSYQEGQIYLQLLYMLLHSQEPLPMTTLRVVDVKLVSKDKIQTIVALFDNGETFSFTRPLP